MNFGRYNAKDTSIIIDNVHITGLSEDMWSFEKDEALAENAVGAQGDVVRSEINNSLYTATVTVQTTSPQVNFLLGLKDRVDPFPLWMINKSLNRREGGSMAMVTEVPSDELGAEAGELEFSFTVYDGAILTD